MSKARFAALALFALVLPAVSELAAQRNRPFKPGYWRTRKDYAEGFVVHHTRHYQIQSQCGLEKAKRLGKHMETMFEVYWRTFNPGKAPGKKQAIKLLKNRAQFLRYGAPPGAGAYYSPMEHEMVCYDTGKWMDEQEDDEAGPLTGSPEELTAEKLFRREQAKYQMDILGAAAHEGWHQYFHWFVVSLVELPSWINEGMGDYFYCARPKKVKGKKIPAEVGRMNHMRLAVVKSAVKRQKHVPIKQLITYSKAQYYANPSICYAQGWALCHFLQHAHEYEGRYKQADDYKWVVRKFIKYVQNDTNMEAVCKKAFRGIDMDELEKDWVDWVTCVQENGSLKEPKQQTNDQGNDVQGAKDQGNKGSGNG